jgi:hypothetical protein
MDQGETKFETEKQLLLRKVQEDLSRLRRFDESIREQVDSIVDDCVGAVPIEITQKTSSTSYLVIMADGGRGGGVSRKLWNIRLTWRERAWDKLEQLGATSAAATIVPWLGVLVVLLVAKTVLDLTEIHLSERHAMVLWASWKVPSHDHIVSVDQILSVLVSANEHFTETEVGSLMSDLHYFECVSREPDGRFRLVESLELRTHLPAR